MQERLDISTAEGGGIFSRSSFPARRVADRRIIAPVISCRRAPPACPAAVAGRERPMP